MSNDAGSVEIHYHRGTILESIVSALRDSGKDLNALTPADLAPVDEFHIRGREATIELAQRISLAPGERVLDVGSGPGGSARYLASECGAEVTGIDLTQEYVEVATALSAMVGLSEQTHFVQGDATHLPFGDGEFDVVWTEHVQMNIEDKARFYREIYRVLRPGGRFIFHDIFAGGGGDVLFPVPWAHDPSLSHLIHPDFLQGLLFSLGFEVTVWEDRSADSAAWFRQMLARVAEKGSAPLGLHILLGSNAPEKFAIILRNLEDERIVVVQAVAKRPSPRR